TKEISCKRQIISISAAAIQPCLPSLNSILLQSPNPSTSSTFVPSCKINRVEPELSGEFLTVLTGDNTIASSSLWNAFLWFHANRVETITTKRATIAPKKAIFLEKEVGPYLKQSNKRA